MVDSDSGIMAHRCCMLHGPAPPGEDYEAPARLWGTYGPRMRSSPFMGGHVISLSLISIPAVSPWRETDACRRLGAVSSLQKASRRGCVGCEDWRRRRTRLDVGGRRLHVRLSAEACSQTQALSRSKRQKSPTVRPRQLNPTKHRAPCPSAIGPSVRLPSVRHRLGGCRSMRDRYGG